MLRRSRSVSVASCAAVDPAPTRVLGIDPSLTCTGWAIRVDGKVISGHIATDKLRGPRRLAYIRDQIAEVIEKYQPEKVAYEDYAMGKAKGGNGRIFDIGELGGLLKTLIWEQGIPVVMVAPTCLKRFLTGKGNPGAKGRVRMTDAQKKAQIRLALQRYFNLLVPQNDEADAVGLMLMGEIKAGVTQAPQDELLSIRLDAITQCSETRGKLQSISNTRK